MDSMSSASLASLTPSRSETRAPSGGAPQQGVSGNESMTPSQPSPRFVGPYASPRVESIGQSTFSPRMSTFGSGGLIQTASVGSGPVIKFYTTSGTQLVRSSGQAGIGLFFEKESHDGSTFPVVKDITHKGSAFREGSVKTGEVLLYIDGRSCRDITLKTLKESVIGLIGTTVELTIFNPSSNAQRTIKLSRASVEYWALYDANLEWKAKYDELRAKNDENENLYHKHKTMAKELQESNDAMEELANNIRSDLVKAREQCRMQSAQIETLEMEKKHQENALENMLNRVAEITLNFKSAESLASEMTERAKMTEGSLQNEAHLRKLSQSREGKVLQEMMLEVQNRQTAEQRLADQEQDMQDLQHRVQQLEVIESAEAQLRLEMLKLRKEYDECTTDLRSARDTAKKFEDGLLTEAKRRAEIEKKMQQLTSSLNETEQKLQKVSATVDQEVAGKNAALAREQALLDEIKHTATQNVAKEAEIARLREDVTAMQKNSDELLRKLAAAELQRDKVFKDKNELQVSLETLKNEKDIAEGKIVSVTKQAEVAEHSLEKMLGNAQAEIQRLLTELKNTTAAATKSKDEMDKEFRVVRNELEKSKADLSTSESKLRAAIAEQGRIRMLNHKLEESVGNEHKELVETRTKCANESTKNEALEARVKKLESDAMKNCQDLEAQKALVAQRGAENKAAKEAFERIQLELENLAKELNLSESAVKDLTLQNTRLQGTCAELEKKLTVREYAFKENVQLNNQMLTLEQEIENIDQDRKRMAETDGQHFGLLDETVKQYEALMDKYNSEILKVKNDYKEEIRDLRLQLDLVEEDKNLLLAELGRFLAMPNPCGVGMKLHESNSFKDPENGKMRRAITVGGMQPGLSADLSGVISIGDELMQVNEFLCEDMRLEDVTGRVVGNRGTQVLFRFRRYSKSGKRNGQPMEYKIVLKRGAWGPEHAVMSPEDIDMIGEGGWPEKGSLMAKDVEMDKITGGSDCSLHYEKKDEPAYGLLKTEGSALDANIKGASLSALNKMGSQGSFNRLGSTNLTEFTA